MKDRVLFARVGWMRWYRGPQPGDEKPIGGGKYTKHKLGHEAFNFLPIGNRVLGYFQPQLQPPDRVDAHPSSIKLERIEPGISSNVLKDVLVVFVAHNPTSGGQYIVGWYHSAKVYRYRQSSPAEKRKKFGYFAEARVADAVLIPEARRSFVVPALKGGFGQANICYTYDDSGNKKRNADWILQAQEYVSSYQHEDAAKNPASEADHEVAELIVGTVERAGGYQSNSRIRKAIEDYTMEWAFKKLKELGMNPRDKHKTKPYDFLCTAGGTDLFVEVKGTQDDGRCISLTPNEVKHAKQHKNSALFIVHSVRVTGKRKPTVSAGKELFVMQWDINCGKLEARGYAFRLPEKVFEQRKGAS
jgi:hypothetical protein